MLTYGRAVRLKKLEGYEHMNRKRNMPMRIVPLSSVEAGDAFVDGTVNERLALVSLLSRRAWATTGRPYPAYTRSAMPIRITRLADQ